MKAIFKALLTGAGLATVGGPALGLAVTEVVGATAQHSKTVDYLRKNIGNFSGCDLGEGYNPPVICPKNQTADAEQLTKDAIAQGNKAIGPAMTAAAPYAYSGTVLTVFATSTAIFYKQRESFGWNDPVEEPILTTVRGYQGV